MEQSTTIAIQPNRTENQSEIAQPDSLTLRTLITQEDMVFWAGAMFFAALATFVVTSVGTLFIAKQAKFTRLAVEENKEATNAMAEANKITRSATDRQLRPYLDVCDVHCGDRDDDGNFMIWYSVKNFGQTPATQLNIRTGRDHLPYPLHAVPPASYDQAENHDVPPGHLRVYFMGFYNNSNANEADWRGMVEQGNGVICFVIEYDYHDPIMDEKVDGSCVVVIDERVLKSGRPRTLLPRDMASFHET